MPWNCSTAVQNRSDEMTPKMRCLLVQKTLKKYQVKYFPMEIRWVVNNYDSGSADITLCKHLNSVSPVWFFFSFQAVKFNILEFLAKTCCLQTSKSGSPKVWMASN